MVRDCIAAEITDFESAKAWIQGLSAANLSFHFDDDPATIVTGVQSDAPHTFTEDEVPIVRERIAALYDFEWGEYDCPIGYVLHIEGHNFGD